MLTLELTYFQRINLFKKFTWNQRGTLLLRRLQMAEMEAARPPPAEARLQMAESWRRRQRQRRIEEMEKTTAKRNDEKERDDTEREGRRERETIQREGRRERERVD
ncbi:hypothetical protein EJD97_021199, partial [Solanum chilense]